MVCIGTDPRAIIVGMRYSQPYERSHGPLYRQPSHRQKRLVTVPDHAPAHVRLFFFEMRRQGRIYDEIEIASGVRRATCKAWRHKTKYPSLESLTATFNSLGWDYHPTPKLEVLSPAIASELAALGAKMKADMPEVWGAMLDIAVQQRDQREQAAARLAKIEADNDNRKRAATAT